MNDHERVLAQLGIEALNASLAGLGYPPVGANHEVRMADPVVGDIPNAVVEKPGVAPIRLMFGRDLDIWIGPYSEVVGAPVGEETRDRIEDLITRVLRSEVLCRYGRRSVELTLRMPGQDPWIRLKVRGGDQKPTLSAQYVPYAQE